MDLGTTAGPQNIAVVRFNPGITPPTFSATTDDFTTLFLTQNNPATGVIPVSIQVTAGDVIGVLGQRGTGTTALTSYGSPNPYSTTIAGQTVELNRMGMQFALTTNAPQSLWQEPTSASIGRIEMTFETGCESTRTSVLATVDNSPGCVPLPVSLISFTGEKFGSINKLKWTTASEINNAGFELQRSADGANFGQLSYVASKAVNGNSTGTLTYTFDDVRPLAANNYYRLKQVDKDGKFTYSPIVLIKGARVDMVSISSIYPNPVKQTLNMVITSPTAEKVNLVVTDVSGRMVQQQAAQLITGDNILRIETGNLSFGTYIIKAVCANGCESAVQKFVKE